jgi:hypothetical protein
VVRYARVAVLAVVKVSGARGALFVAGDGGVGAGDRVVVDIDLK